ncbi:putative pectinesterase/pectinesterase inhibitor 20 [Nymphaea thermarum]|nr:putative pectinesterase/pectinesterase inhibitor 20 [Nymphaea thermarum]
MADMTHEEFCAKHRISDASINVTGNNIAEGFNCLQNLYGYYVIKIKEGVYEEYVSVNSSKTDIMMVGAGINKTVITGNCSVGDGLTTFNSATFSATFSSPDLISTFQVICVRLQSGGTSWECA